MSIEPILARMRQIVYEEGRPFSFKDLVCFELDGVVFTFTPGHIRNILSKLTKEGKIERVYRSTEAFYTLKGVKVGNAMTYNRTGVTRPRNHRYTYSQQRLEGYLNNIPMGDRGIHDIRLKFGAKGLWEILPMYSDAEYFVENMDVKGNRSHVLFNMDFQDHVIKPTVQRTDTVEVTVACSFDPIPINLLGIAKLNGSLVSLKERLQRVVDEHVKTTLKSKRLSSDVLIAKDPIPDPLNWIVTMWHFGRDSRYEYSGDMFKMTRKDGLGVFHQVYSKEFKDRKNVKIRDEVLERPNKPLGQAFMDKLEDEINSNEEDGEDEKDPDQPPPPSNIKKMKLGSPCDTDNDGQGFAHTARKDMCCIRKSWNTSIHPYPYLNPSINQVFNLLTKCILISRVIQLVILSLVANGGVVIV